MAVPIQRATGPQPIGEQKGEFSWTIPLSATPSREWLKFFNTPSELAGACMPSLVSFHQRDMVFAAREEQIKEWYSRSTSGSRWRTNVPRPRTPGANRRSSASSAAWRRRRPA